MKKYLYIAIASLLALASCDKEACVQEEVPGNGPDGEQLVTITASIPEDGLNTKVSLTEADNGEGKMRLIKLSWEEGDVIAVNGETFTVKPGSISGDGLTATFQGKDPGAGPYTITYTNVPGDLNNQVQPADGDPSEVGYSVSLTGADAYEGATFSSAWAGSHGATFAQSSVLQLRALLPAAVAADVKKVIFKSSADIFNGSNTLTVTLTTKGTAGTDKKLDVYAMLPAGNITLAADMDLLVQFEMDGGNAYDKYTAFRHFASGTEFVQSGCTKYLGLDCSNIESFANASTASIGESSSNPYLVGDQHQFEAVAALMASGTTYIKLVDDIDMTGVTTSLNAADPYDKAVNFDGQSKTLSNTTAPLFYDINGTVKDFTIYNANISDAETVGILARTCNIAASSVSGITVSGSTLTSTATASRKSVGGLVGQVTTLSTFDDCHIIDSEITSPDANDYTYTGGVFGSIIASTASNTGYYKNFTVESSTISSHSYVGGVVGYFDRGHTQNNKVGFDKDDNAKKCTITGADTHVGGVAGYHRRGYVNNNTTFCDVSGGNSVGGLTGYMRAGETEGNSTSGEITLSTHYAGGLVGTMAGGTVTDNYSSCSITGSGDTYVYEGGLIGNVTAGTIQKSYATGSISSDKAALGGLIGEIDGTVSVLSCFASGNIAVGNTKYTFRGGLIGNVKSGTVSISNCYATGKVEAYRWSSGLIGSAASEALTVANCYTSSVLDISHEKTQYGVFIGNANTKSITYSGIIAWNTSSKTNFIYNTTVTSAPDGNYFGIEGTINSQATTLGWGSVVDESSNPVWDLTWGDNRPHLAWEPKP